MEVNNRPQALKIPFHSWQMRTRSDTSAERIQCWHKAHTELSHAPVLLPGTGWYHSMGLSPGHHPERLFVALAAAPRPWATVPAPSLSWLHPTHRCLCDFVIL